MLSCYIFKNTFNVLLIQLAAYVTKNLITPIKKKIEDKSCNNSKNFHWLNKINLEWTMDRLVSPFRKNNYFKQKNKA